MRATVLAFSGIRAEEAVEAARRVARNAHWQLGFVSNAGVTCSVTSPVYGDPDESLMQPDGTAGQWVVEFFRTPYATAANRRWYRIRSIVVTPFDVDVLPDDEFGQVEELWPLRDRDLAGLDTARRWAVRQVRKPYDALSVASDARRDGCSWEFTFLRRRFPRASQEIVGRVRVPGSD